MWSSREVLDWKGYSEFSICNLQMTSFVLSSANEEHIYKLKLIFELPVVVPDLKISINNSTVSLHWCR